MSCLGETKTNKTCKRAKSMREIERLWKVKEGEAERCGRNRGAEGERGRGSEWSRGAHISKELILANGSLRTRPNPCRYVIDWLTWKCAWSVLVSWRGGLGDSRKRAPLIPPTHTLQVKPPTHSGTCPEDFSVLRKRRKKKKRGVLEELLLSLQSCQC